MKLFPSLVTAFAVLALPHRALSYALYPRELDVSPRSDANAASRGIRLINKEENVLIQPWGPDGFRVRATLNKLPEKDDHSVIIDPPLDGPKTAPIGISYSTIINATQNASLTNGFASVTVSDKKISFYRVDGPNSTLVLEEVWPTTPGFDARWYGRTDNRRGFRAQFTFTTPDSPSERLFGTGQDLTGYINRKNHTIDLVKFNTLNPIPAIMSDRGYLFFWNVPSLGQLELSPTRTRFLSDHTTIVDYYIAIRPPGDYDGLQKRYTGVTGRSPMMPDWGMGYWQCKLRYATQDELINVTTEFAKREIPVSLFIIDFLSWSHEGDWALNASAYPDPAKMAAEVKKLTGAEMMASVWPSIEDASPNFPYASSLGLLTQTANPLDIAGYWQGRYMHLYDPTNPAAREFLWSTLKRNYYQNGIKNFWLDEDEGGQVANDIYPWMNYYIGPGNEYAMLFPFLHQMGVFEGQKNASGDISTVTLSRSSWAGSQRFASAVWSGDIFSTWDSMETMIAAGQSMALSGQGWWTLDIGGFKTNGLPNSANVSDPEYQELFVRWIQWGTFLPVMRNHGDRTCLPSAQEGFLTCPNEPWSYGADNEPIIVDYIKFRYKLKPYIKVLFKRLSESGLAIMRPMFMDFWSSDPYTLDATEELKLQYMFGPRLLVKPVTTYKATEARVYLPKLPSSAPDAKWTYWWTNKTYDGGQWVTVPANKSVIPLFRLGSEADILSGNV